MFGKERAVLGLCTLVLACGLAVDGSSAHAASAAAISADRETVVRGLEAQYSAVLIKERKLADDRETRLLGAAEARLTKARAELSAVKRESATELGAARADYAKLAAGIVQRDAVAQAEIEAYRAEAEQRVAQATPAELAALQQFADGDRVVAEPLLMSIRDARKRATLKAAAMRIAHDERATAEEHDVMRLHGEATMAEVLKLYETAAEDDPNDWKTNWLIGDLSFQQSEYDHAAAAFARAAAVARTDYERQSSSRSLGFTQVLQTKFSDADKNLQQALHLALKLAAAEPKSFAAVHDLVYCYLHLSQLRSAQGDTKGALAFLKPALEVASRADASSTNILFLLADVNAQMGDAQYAVGDTKAALLSYQAMFEFGRRAAAIDPKSSRARAYQGDALRRIGWGDGVLGDKKAELANYNASIEILRELVVQDPTSAQWQGNLADGLNAIGAAQDENHDLVGALRSFQEGLDIRKTLAAQHPDSAALQISAAMLRGSLGDIEREQGDKTAALADLRGALDVGRKFVGKDPTGVIAVVVVAEALDNLAQIPGSGVSWAEVLAQFQGMQDRGQLYSGLQTEFDEAKRQAAEEAKAKQGGAK